MPTWWNNLIQRILELTPFAQDQDFSEPQRVTEQLDPTMFASAAPTQEDWYWGRLAGGMEEDYYWRRLSDNWFQKDLIPSTYLEVHNACYEAYNANPLAFAIIELTTSFVLGDGPTVTARNPRVQKILMDFWHDPDNHMDDRCYSLCTELALYGEQFIHFFVNTYDGTVKIRQIDPSVIDEIETDPEDIETLWRIHRRPIGQVMSSPTGDPTILAPNVSQGTAGTWFSARTNDPDKPPEVMQFAVNKVSNAKRGKSDLATLLPWLRRYKDWLTDRVRINKYKGAFLYDVTLQGADKKAIDRKKMEYGYPPEPGSVLIHNESERWTAVQPNINANDASGDGRQIKLMVAVGASLPEHYLSDGTSSNRATAAEMGLPTLLRFKRRQRVVKTMLTAILDRVIFEAKRVGKLGPHIDTSYDIVMPEIDTSANPLLAQGLNYLINALATAKAQGWLSDETAMRLLFQFAGAEVDVHEEASRIRTSTGGGRPPGSPPEAFT
jgi:hypothetical protein